MSKKTDGKSKGKKGKKIWILSLSAVAVAAALLLYLFLGGGGESGNKIYVMSVSEVTGSGLIGTTNRFSGVVESQETQELKIEQNRTVDEVLVEVGDVVNSGDPLFSYTTEDIARQMSQASIDIEGMRNTIKSSRDEIGVLEQERQGAPAEGQLEYTLRIQSLLASISQTEYNIKTKQVEYDQLKKSYDNSVVTATLAGTVQAINDPGATDPYTGSSLAFMVIMKGGDFLLKGTVSELNVHGLSTGMRIIARSRIDEEQMWGGTIITIDTSQTEDNNANGGYYYGGMSDSGESASKYAFYVELDSVLGLMIGQHVTIELDIGQGSESSGLWLSSYYLLDLESGKPYVLADNGNDRLEKRPVEIGSYNEEMDTYEILGGLTAEDYIAFPDPTIEAGMPTTREFIIPEDAGMEEPMTEDPGMIGGPDMAVSSEPAPAMQK